MSLIPIICTHEVSPTVITSILSTAYKASTDAAELQDYTDDSVTKLPVESLQYPFLGWDIGKIAQFLQENTSDTIVDYTTFLVADEKTALDEDTLLLVYDVEGLQESIRLSACFANSEAVSVSVATKDVGELWTLADEDGVYRGGPQHPPPKKGGKAPRKRL
ncbi:conserved hypothetical protein [Aspergillus fumigatus Af293]|uniref:DUF6924 domain-containing protein n=1 Tax=Aspergillus fumigatus (strain ATCC MYA-4609 / CBS 101355 / FGSC A1100 / Af293) TaxID=330879 RepID=Q4WQU3_ASPFU|nr:conserved hypothetical protein [Aspergillus fumigatus Af293]EAL89391.1 conserved hypothetical protein [Aspergillus fumigatus Af293]